MPCKYLPADEKKDIVLRKKSRKENVALKHLGANLAVGGPSSKKKSELVCQNWSELVGTG